MIGLLYIAITTILMLGAVYEKPGLALVIVAGLVLGVVTWLWVARRG